MKLNYTGCATLFPSPLTKVKYSNAYLRRHFKGQHFRPLSSKRRCNVNDKSKKKTSVPSMIQISNKTKRIHLRRSRGSGTYGINPLLTLPFMRAA